MPDNRRGRCGSKEAASPLRSSARLVGVLSCAPVGGGPSGVGLEPIKMAGGGLDERRAGEAAEMSGRLRKRLGAMVRSVGWSYAIYWCNRSDRPRARGGGAVLEWRDGCYNGEIRTRRTQHPPDDDDLRPDGLGLRRTTQLRELYESLSGAGRGGDERRPSSAASQLSPEDLTHSEWYFLVCMSFTFANGQGLPGRTSSSGKEIWLCNAQFADYKTFTRSLLAKSASIQTIVCAPFMGGVLELGTTEHVYENKDLIKHLTSSRSKLPISVSSGPSQCSPRRDEEEEGQVATPSVGIAKTRAYATLHSDENQKISSDTLNRNILSEIDDGNIWPENNGLPPTASPYAMHSRTSSGFTAWKKSSIMDAPQKEKPATGPQQKMLKKILSHDCSNRDVGDLDVVDHDNNKNNFVGLSGHYETTMTMKRSELLNERFLALKSLVPSLKEVDKASVIEDTIDYVKELEGRLEACEALSAAERVDQRGRRDHVASEKTSDNYGGTPELIVAGEAVAQQQCTTILPAEKGRCCSLADITVSTLAGGREVVVEMCCPWREVLLLEIIDAIGGVHLEINSMQTSTVDGCLYLTIKSMLQGPAPVSPRAIKQALCRVVTSCC